MNKIIEIAKAKGADGEYLQKEVHSTSLSFQDGKLEEVTKRDIQDFSLRIIKNSKLSAVYGSKPSNREKLIDSAIELSKEGRQVTYQFSDKAEIPNLKLTSGKTKKITVKELKEIGEDLIVRLKKFTDVSPDIGVSTSNSVKSLVTTNGAKLKEKTTSFSVSVLLKIPGSAG
ncbi:MAG TPA: hypothetical protein ENN73_06105, partial [Firmicutes bacterium]|nr:hypothetical protein [Bacillota bacterium]